MLRHVLSFELLPISFGGWCQASSNDSTAKESSSKQQPVDINTPPTTQQPSEQQPTEPSKKKSSKLSRKVDEVLPDCVNLIFYHGCRHSDARQQDADEKQQQKLVEAADRCKQLSAALPPSLAAKTGERTAPENAANPNESSSKQPHQPIPYCTPEDVVAADHDVDVGDFNFKEKNYRGAEMRYRSALERLPSEPVATLHLARALEKLGNKAEAYAQYKIFLEWSPTGKDAEEANAALARLQKELALK
jgi:tetratricopeptide (TPR) repeat protein